MNGEVSVQSDRIEILTPWREVSLLHDFRKAWIDLPIALPPSLADLRREAMILMDRLDRLERPEEAGRKLEILRQRDLDLVDYLGPLGASEEGGFGETTRPFLIIARICEEVGLRCKEGYDTPRPSVVEPRLRTFLANPPYASYPSNHSFQSFTMAYVFSRVMPEHPGVAALFRSALRVAENREWAGIHYPSDTRAGKQQTRMFTPVLEVVLQEQMLRALWHLKDIGVVTDLKSFAGPAWDLAAARLANGAPATRVALIDVSVAYTHPTLRRRSAQIS